MDHRLLLTAALSVSLSLASCQRERRARPAPPKLEPVEEPAVEENPTLVPDEAVTLADMAELKKSDRRVLYILPYVLTAPEAPQVERGWAMAWGSGRQFDEWQALPPDADMQVEYLRRFYKKHHQDWQPIETVVAYSKEMGLEELGAMSQVLDATSENVPRRYYKASIIQAERAGVEVPDKLARHW